MIAVGLTHVATIFAAVMFVASGAPLGVAKGP